MLVRLQFILRVDGGKAVAWPRESRSNGMYLTCNPLESIGYGSDDVALADLDRWLDKFPSIEETEVTTFIGD